MTWFDDLTDYSYDQQPGLTPCVNVGWLDGAKDYPRGPVPEGFVERLEQFCQIHVHATMDVHSCTLDGCGEEEADGWYVESELDAYLDPPPRGLLGAAEIRAFGADGVIYAAPNMIVHYVADHEYRPPDGFIEAILHGPQPREFEYARRLVEHTPDLDWYDEDLFRRLKIGWWRARKWRRHVREVAYQRQRAKRERVQGKTRRLQQAMIERHGQAKNRCAMTDCRQRALSERSFCVAHTPIDPDIVLADS